MELHQRQQFDFLLMTAVERFVDRVEQRNGSADAALALLQRDPNAQAIWLHEFVAAMFRDFLLDIGGACFVLEAFPERTVESAAGTAQTVLIAMAKAAFAGLLREKTEEALEQRLAFQVRGGRGSR